MTAHAASPRLLVEVLEDRVNPTDFLVTSDADGFAADGKLTLYEAMASIWRKFDPNNPNFPANFPADVPVATDRNTIKFDILAARVAAVEIQLTQQLPPFYDSTMIDGYSQPGPNGLAAGGATRNTAVYGSNADIRIGINGAQLQAGQATGFRGQLGHALTVGQITGLSLYGFADAAIDLSGVGYRLYPNNEFTPNLEDIREMNVQVSGNFIGVKPDGATLGTPNNGVGILSTRSTQFVIGGPTRGDRNVISNSVTDGIRIENQTNALVNDDDENNILYFPRKMVYISNNLIGTTPNGLSAIPNGRNGIRVSASSNVLIGGASSVAPGASAQDEQWTPFPGGDPFFPRPFELAKSVGNVISGNASDGVAVLVSGGYTSRRAGAGEAGLGVRIAGNLIGIGADDKSVVANGDSGVRVSNSSEVHISGNVLSDNRGSGVSIEVSPDDARQRNYVVENKIGLTSTGQGAHSNFGSGVSVRGPVRYTRILNNVIGHNSEGILIGRGKGLGAENVPDDVRIWGNTIGYEQDKTTPARNDIRGIIVTGGKHLSIANDKDQEPPPPVGQGMGNAAGVTVIGANGGAGIELQGDDTTDATIDGALIRANEGSGIIVGVGVTNVTIGTAGLGNEIIANLGDGIHADLGILGAVPLGLTAAYNTVAHNGGSGLALVGDSMLAADDPAAGAVVHDNDFFANVLDGVTVTLGGAHQFTDNLAHGNGRNGFRLVGDTRYNHIAGGSVYENDAAGLATTVTPGLGNTSLGTTYVNNGGLGIDRGDDGVTVASVPRLTAKIEAGAWLVSGILSGVEGDQYVVQFFDNAAVDPSYYGEGQVFLGSVAVTIGPDGRARFAGPAPVYGSLSTLPNVRATATRLAPDGWTSEFSQIEPPPVVSGWVFYDGWEYTNASTAWDRDGIQNGNGDGYAGLTVHLLDAAGTVVDTTTTNAAGSYTFVLRWPGSYRVQFTLPTTPDPYLSYRFSPPDQGGDDALDSDADATTGLTALFDIDLGETKHQDAGVIWRYYYHLPPPPPPPPPMSPPPMSPPPMSPPPPPMSPPPP